MVSQLDKVSFLKVRASVGRTGNADILMMLNLGDIVQKSSTWPVSRLCLMQFSQQPTCLGDNLDN